MNEDTQLRLLESRAKSVEGWSGLITALIVGISLFFFTNILIRMPQYIANLYNYVVSVIGVVPAAMVFGTITLPLGYAFFQIREKKRILYGYLEIGFGVLSAILTVGNQSEWKPFDAVNKVNLITYVALFTSIYIIVRGFDNLQQGKKQIAECYDLLDAAEQNNIDKVKYLLEKGVDVNYQTRKKPTPLLLAVDKGNAEIVKILLNKGADKNSKNLEGKTALIIAKEINNEELIALLSAKTDSK